MIAFAGRAFGRWLGHLGGTLMNEISAFMKETPETSLNPTSSVWEHGEKMAIYEPGSKLSPDTKFVHVLILADSTSRTVRNKLISVVYKP